jgi:hypothetical protein
VKRTVKPDRSDPVPSIPAVEELPPLPAEDSWDESITLDIDELYVQETEFDPADDPNDRVTIQQPDDEHESEPEDRSIDATDVNLKSDAGSHPIPSADSLGPPSLAFYGDDQMEQRDPRMITIILRSTGDQQRDALRMRRVHGLLTSYPGNDRFVFHVFEISRRYHLEFPSSSTGYCRELHAQLHSLLGEDSVQVEPLRFQ